MKYTICAYRDTQLKVFLAPFTIPQDPESIKEGVIHAAIKGKVEDCGCKELYFLGQFDTADASIELVRQPELLVDLAPYAKSSDAN